MMVDGVSDHLTRCVSSQSRVPHACSRLDLYLEFDTRSQAIDDPDQAIQGDEHALGFPISYDLSSKGDFIPSQNL